MQSSSVAIWYYLSPALIWSLLWKYGGLLLHPDTLLFPPFKSYYNFVALNNAQDSVKSNIFQFMDRHHELTGKALHHMMEQSLKHKAYQQKKDAENLLRMDIVGINDNEMNIALNDITSNQRAKEVETFCDRPISKVMFVLNTSLADYECIRFT